jgi:hypothetical protein
MYRCSALPLADGSGIPLGDQCQPSAPAILEGPSHGAQDTRDVIGSRNWIRPRSDDHVGRREKRRDRTSQWRTRFRPRLQSTSHKSPRQPCIRPGSVPSSCSGRSPAPNHPLKKSPPSPQLLPQIPETVTAQTYLENIDSEPQSTLDGAPMRLHHGIGRPAAAPRIARGRADVQQ